MKGAPQFTTPSHYLESLPEGRRQELETLHARLLKDAPQLTPWMVYGMIGYGHVERQSGNRKPRKAPIVSVAAQVRHICIYLGGHDTTTTLDPQWGRQLGQAAISGCCIRFKRLSDIDMDALVEVILNTSPIA